MVLINHKILTFMVKTGHLFNPLITIKRLKVTGFNCLMYNDLSQNEK